MKGTTRMTNAAARAAVGASIFALVLASLVHAPVDAAELAPIGGPGVLGALTTPGPFVAQATIEGTWTTRARVSESGRRRVQVSLELGDDTGTWGWSVDPDDLDGLSFDQFNGDVADARFELVRDAGTIAFVGVIRGGRGIGEFTFTPNGSWQRGMDSYGYDDLSDRQVFSAAIHDITLEYVGDLRQLGYTDLAARDLFSFAIHRVSIEFIRGMNDLGYAEIPARKLVSMRIHGVTLEWVREVRAAMGR